jgi:hypothetical protein
VLLLSLLLPLHEARWPGRLALMHSPQVPLIVLGNKVAIATAAPQEEPFVLTSRSVSGAVHCARQQG